MKVILVSKVANLGDIGDVIDVKPGFARNFLIPKGNAIYYSKANYKSFEDKKKEFEAKNQELISQAKKVQSLISGKDIIIIENASDDGRLYGAVNTNVIANKINEIDKDISLSKSNIVLDKPIKDIGLYQILVKLYSDIDVNLRLIISRNESEVASIIEKAKKANSKKDSAAKDSEGAEDVKLASEA